MNIYKSYLKYAILLLALSVAFMAPHFSQTHFVFGGDVVGYFLPIWTFIAQTVQSGELPLWIPFLSSGLPSPLTFNYLLYPPNLLFVIFSFPLALTLIYLFHLWFAGFGAYLLASRNGIGRVGSLLAGCAFMFSAPLIVRIWAGHLGNVETHPWIPWVVFCTLNAIKKRNVFWICLAGAVSSVLLLLSAFQTLLYAFLLLGLLWAWQIVANLIHYRQQIKLDTIRAIVSLPLVGMIAICLAAVAVFPALELSGSMVRSSSVVEYASATISSYSPAQLLTMIVPDLFGLAWKGTESYIAGAYYCESMVYVGALTLALALLAIVKIKRREVRWTLLLTSIALLIMLGRYTPFYWLIFKFVPGAQLFRIPARAHVFVALGLAILAGYGFDFLVNASLKTTKDKMARALAIGGLIPGFLVVGMILSPDVMRVYVIRALAAISSAGVWGPSPGAEEIARLLSLQWVDLSIAFSRASLTLLAGAICVKLLMYTSLRRRAVSLLILMVVIVDLWSYGAGFLVPVSKSEVYAPNDYLRLVTEKSEFYRVYGGPILPHNGGLIFGYFDVESSSNAILQRYWNFIAPLDQNKPDVYAQQTFLPVFDDRVLYMLNVRYAALGSPVAGQGWKLLKHGYFDRVVVPSFISLKKYEAWIYERIDPLPRAYLVGRCRNLDDASALVTVRATSFDPLAEVVLPPDQVCPKGSAGSIGTATITSYKVNSIDLDVTAEKPGYLVMSEIYYPGWKGYVDGRATDVLRANYTFRAIPIEAGVHKIHMVYRPLGLMIGLWISLASLVLIVLANIIIFYKKRHKNTLEAQQTSLLK